MSITYPLYDSDETTFEKLTALICEEILGTGVIVFSDGKDGGRDAKFTGRANNFPSETAPWKGKFIIQAKHTSSPIASCVDTSFKAILRKELPKLKKLKEADKVDFYLLFTNRKLSGLEDPKIEDLIDKETGVTNCILGDERIQLWLTKYPQIVRTLNLNKLLFPLEFYEQDLQQIIITFSKVKKKHPLKNIQTDLHRISLKEKNRLNQLGKTYFDNMVKKSYADFEAIKDFLVNPENATYKEMYDNTVSDLQAEIMFHRDNYYAFEDIFYHLKKLILDETNQNLLNSRRLINVFLHYMYFNCDIGIQN